jgi:predicted Fe-Mo cluster-binding NifX family protein
LPKRIVIPASSQDGLKSHLADHFGRAPYFVAVDLNEKGEVTNVKNIVNVPHGTGRMGQPHEIVLGLQPDVIISYGMGRRGIASFQSVGIAVLRANENTIDEVIAAYKENKLQELTEGCHDARHP